MLRCPSGLARTLVGAGARVFCMVLRFARIRKNHYLDLVNSRSPIFHLLSLPLLRIRRVLSRLVVFSCFLLAHVTVLLHAVQDKGGQLSCYCCNTRKKGRLRVRFILGAVVLRYVV